MDEEQRWLSYRYDRILIESDRIITPTLPGCTLVLSGAQVEMLRNCVQYLDRRSTFVSEYEELRYQTPNDADWDDILAIVADLEEELMGNINVPWGYTEPYGEKETLTVTVGGTNILTFSSVPTGRIRVVTGFSFYCSTVNPQNITYRPQIAGTIVYACGRTTAAAWQVYPYALNVVQQAADTAEAYYYNCVIGDTLIGMAWGYEMIV